MTEQLFWMITANHLAHIGPARTELFLIGNECADVIIQPDFEGIESIALQVGRPIGA